MNANANPTQADGIWIIDAEGKTVYANQAMSDILGTTMAEIIGEHSFQYVYPDDLPAAQRLFASKQAGSPGSFRFKLRRKDGSAVWVNVQGTPTRNAAGAFTGVLGTFTVSDSQEPQPHTWRSSSSAEQPVDERIR
jgi:PAS domain S-box-containing protein